MKTKRGFECTDEDLAEGGYILPRDPRLNREPTPEERELLLQQFRAYSALKELGWRDAIYAPSGEPLLLIEIGSTGVHEGYRDKIGFWICDGDTWPSHPILWRQDERVGKAEP